MNPNQTIEKNSPDSSAIVDMYKAMKDDSVALKTMEGILAKTLEKSVFTETTPDPGIENFLKDIKKEYGVNKGTWSIGTEEQNLNSLITKYTDSDGIVSRMFSAADSVLAYRKATGDLNMTLDGKFGNSYKTAISNEIEQHRENGQYNAKNPLNLIKIINKENIGEE